MINTNEKKIKSVLENGIDSCIKKENLEKKLKSGKQLNIKFGIDPTGFELHLGHSIALKKLQELQELGHKITFVIGSFTAQIGDPTGKSGTRIMLSRDEIEKNMKNYKTEASKILDITKVGFFYNHEWLEHLTLDEMIKICQNITVSQMVERDMFQKRIKESKPIFLHEFFYPIMQGYDSVVLKTDIELGGTDQTFNILMGRMMQKHFKIKQQDAIILPILEGTDGEKKMSKSENNFIALSDTPKNMYGKIMSIPDNLILKYFDLCTNCKKDEINEIKNQMEKGGNPKNAKNYLAKKIIEIYYNEKDANSAEKEFLEIFKKKGLPNKIPKFNFKNEKNILEILTESNLLNSKSEVRRMIRQGAIKINDEKINDENLFLSCKGQIIKCGKRKFLQLAKS